MSNKAIYDDIIGKFMSSFDLCSDLKRDNISNSRIVINWCFTAEEFSELCEAHTRKVVESVLENMPAYRSIADKYVLPDGSRLSPDAIEEALYKFSEDIKANSSPFKFISTKETAK